MSNAHPLASTNVVLLNLSDPEKVRCSLEKILVPYFKLSVMGYSSDESLDGKRFPKTCSLSKLMTVSNPAIAFLVSAREPAQAKQLLALIKRELPLIPLLVLVEAVTPDEMLDWLRLGAADFLITPLRAIDVMPRIWRVLECPTPAVPEPKSLNASTAIEELVGENQEFLKQIEKIPAIAKCDASVLISGETGTGKELCARAIHYLSPRSREAFIPVNCGAIPADLVENELFGHEQGAFTGARTSRSGLISEADGGTLFLDEVDCLPLLSQVKLLRFLQEKEFRSLGSSRIRKADVRILAATNADCEEAVNSGKFRRDLYYRLNVIPLSLPSLRERGEDILLLARHFLVKHATQLNKEMAGFSSNAIQKLYFHEWPGNVRELDHIIMRAVVLSNQAVIRAADITLAHHETPAISESFRVAKAKIVSEFERKYVRSLLLKSRGNVSAAARLAGKNRRAFWELIRKHHISVKNLRSTGS